MSDMLTAFFDIRSGQEEYERLRPMSYSKSHVILIAFAIDTPDSLDNVAAKVSFTRRRLERSRLSRVRSG